MRTVLALVLGLAMAGCWEGAPPPPGLTPGPAPIGCVPIESAMIGVWQREGRLEELRTSGAFLLNADEGAWRWRPDGTLVTDVSGRHEERLVGLTDVNEMIAVENDGVGHVSSRISPPRTIPPDCYDVRTSIVGEWSVRGGEETLTFEASGAYRAEGVQGSWAQPTPGVITLRTTEGESTHRFAELPGGGAILLEQVEGARARVLRRAR